MYWWSVEQTYCRFTSNTYYQQKSEEALFSGFCCVPFPEIQENYT